MKVKNQYQLFATLSFCVFIAATFSFTGRHKTSTAPFGWCDKPLRPELKSLKEIKTSRPCFKVYDLGGGTYAIDEPYQWEETIACLILGKKKALLFDTGMGLDSISLVVRELTKLPVWVLSSHTHPDHNGGNHEFDHILAMNTAYTRLHEANGYPHEEVRFEVTPSAFCLARLPHTDTARYFTRPFKVSRFITGGYIIHLVTRKLQVIATPGHTPDAICLYDKRASYLWTGDSFYGGPIFLFSGGTDLKAYQQSINTIAKFARAAVRILLAHNLPLAHPAWVVEAANDFNQIIKGEKKGHAPGNTIPWYLIVVNSPAR